MFKILNARDRVLLSSKPVSRRTPWPLRNVCAQYNPFTATSSLSSLFTIYVTAVLAARFDSNILCKSTFQLDRTEDYAFNYRPHVKLTGRKVYHHNHYSPSHPILSVNTSWLLFFNNRSVFHWYIFFISLSLKSDIHSCFQLCVTFSLTDSHVLFSS